MLDFARRHSRVAGNHCGHALLLRVTDPRPVWDGYAAAVCHIGCRPFRPWGVLVELYPALQAGYHLTGFQPPGGGGVLWCRRWDLARRRLLTVCVAAGHGSALRRFFDFPADSKRKRVAFSGRHFNFAA